MSLQRTRILNERQAKENPLMVVLVVCMYLSIVFSPLAHLVATSAKRSRDRALCAEMWAAARAAFLRYVGEGKALYLDIDVAGREGAASALCASGIATDGENIYFMQYGVAVTIPWSMVRKWHWKIEGHTKFTGFGSGAARSTAHDQTAASYRDARLVSGLYLSIADSEAPEWFFQTDSRQLLTKWQEVLTQLKEGRLKATAAKLGA